MAIALLTIPVAAPAATSAPETPVGSMARGTVRETVGIRLEFPDILGQTSDSRQLMANLAGAHFNAVYCSVGPDVLQDPRFPQMLQAARARGIEVHAVLSTFLAIGHNLKESADPGLSTIDSSGDAVGRWLDPCKPRVRSMVVDFATSVSRLGVDGVQMDYFRFGGPDLGFSVECRKVFEAWAATHAGGMWEDWRDTVITAYAAEVRAAVKAASPRIAFSCSTWTVGPGWKMKKTVLTPDGEGYGWRQGQDLGQLSAQCDSIRPMLYSCYLHKEADWVGTMTRLAVKNAGGRCAIIPGIACAVGEKGQRHYTSISREELRRIITGVRKAGGKGLVIFNYDAVFGPDGAAAGFADELRQSFPAPEPLIPATGRASN